jgi:endonuclease/exonuclease/phosphatase family metal-dependent hydrolase
MAPAGSTAQAQNETKPADRLRLLSYNFQTGVGMQHYREYVTKSWKHLVPLRERQANLNRIAEHLNHYDIVGLQEVDSGSLRSGFLDQTEYLAHRAGFPHWYRQVNRNLGKFAQHSNGVLTRLRPLSFDDHKLPGLPGRGAIVVKYETTDSPLLVAILHLSLGRRARTLQLGYISELIQEDTHLVIMGDFNCGYKDKEMRDMVEKTGLQRPACDQMTYPSWRPIHKLDHILVSPSLTVQNSSVLDYSGSDHLPISLEIALPKGVSLTAEYQHASASAGHV